MPCLRCSCETEAGTLICDACADACYADPEFFLTPSLVGDSVFRRLRELGSAAYVLGPTSSSPVVLLPSADLEKALKDLPVQGVRKEDLRRIYGRFNTILAHFGVPLRADVPQLLLTSDAADMITATARKVNALEQMFPGEGISDLYVRIGLVYWCATKSILLRTASQKWREDRAKYLFSRAKEYLSRVGFQDELFSISSRTLGLVCLDAGDWAEAEEHFTESLRHFPDDVVILHGLARAHLALGNQMEALTRVDEALVQGETAQLWSLKGKVLHGMDRLEESLECFNMAITLDARCIEAHNLLISTLNQLGRLDDATLAENQRMAARKPWLEEKVQQLVAELKMAAVEEPEGPRPARGRKRKKKVKAAPPPKVPEDPLEPIRTALSEGEYDLAIQRAKHILKQKADMQEAQLLLIQALLEKGQLKEVTPLVHSYYEKNQDDPAAWYWRGRLADREGRWGAAVQYFSKAVTLAKEFVDAWLEMGDVLLAHGKVSGADESYSRTIQLDSENARAWLGKGRAMRQLGRWGAAIQCLDKYNTLVPDDEEAWFLKAEILQEKGKLERALEAYDKYLSSVPDDAVALGRKGIVLNSLGREDEARACLEESVRLDPQNKEAVKWFKSIVGGEP